MSSKEPKNSSKSISGIQNLLVQQTSTICKHIDAVWDHLENDFETVPGELDKLQARRDSAKTKAAESYAIILDFLEFVEIFVDAKPAWKKKDLFSLLLRLCGAIYDHVVINLRLQERCLIVYNPKDHPTKLEKAQAMKAELLEQQSDLNIRYSNYRTRLLIEHGAFKQTKNPLLAGFPEPKPDNYKSYIKNKQAGIGKVATAVKGGASAAKIKSMLDHGEDPNELDTTNWNRPLHHAARECMPQLPSLVSTTILSLRLGKVQTLRGFSPLHFAHQKHFKKAVQVLLKFKADPATKSSLGQVPKDMAHTT